MLLTVLFLLSGCALSVSAIAIKHARDTREACRLMADHVKSIEPAERLTPAKLAELAAFNEALARCEELLVKVNRREIARAKKRADDGTFSDHVNGTDKDALRRIAGLRAGQPARHQ